MKQLSILAITLLTSNLIVGQIRLPDPKSNSIKLTEFQKNYHDLKELTDSSYYHEMKITDRWINDVSSRLHITNDSVYSSEEYADAFKDMIISGLICSDADAASWENIGPRYVGQENGLVNAVYMHPSNSDELLIGASTAGIFKTIDHGTTWVCVTDDLSTPILGIRQIVGDPFDADHLLAVTGTSSGLDPVQTGYLESTDGGDTWEIGDYSGLDDEFQWFCFDPTIQGRIYAVMKENLMYSIDGGVLWYSIYLPGDLPTNIPGAIKTVELQRLIYAGGNLILSNFSEEYTGFWRGAIVPNGSYIDVNWSSNLALPLVVPSTQTIVSPGVPSTINYLTDYTDRPFPIYDYKTTPGLGCGYDTNLIYPYYDVNDTANSNLNPFSGVWSIIKTNGWQWEALNGIAERHTCINTNTHDLEITTATMVLPKSIMLNSTLRSIELNCEIPKGVTLKVCFSPYCQIPKTLFTHPLSAICNVPDFDYDTIFSNVLYAFSASSDTTLDVFQNFTLSSWVEEILEATSGGGNVAGSLYFILDFDPLVYVPGEKFILTKFDIRNSVDRSDLVTLSNAVDDRFFVHVRGNEKSRIYRSLDAGLTFQVVADSLLEDAKIDKDELVASIVDSNVFYSAQIVIPTYYNVLGNNTYFSVGNGGHDDYRSSYIAVVGGNERILWGNDGGVAESINAYTGSGSLNSLNGDLSINMIYNLDVHEKVGSILIGLQDNGSREFYANQNGWTSVNAGDGCVAKIRDEYPGTRIVGDPQYPNSSALKDSPDTNGIVSNAIDIVKGEAYLGMRLEEFRFDDERFVVGLQELGTEPNGKLLINTSANNNEKVIVSGSEKLGAIAICQRKPHVIYVADNTYQFPDDSVRAKIFKTTNGGLTSGDWTPLYPKVKIFTGDSIDLSFELQWDFVTSLAADHIDSNVVYAGMSGIGMYQQPFNPLVIKNQYLRVIKSVDGGQSFTDWSEGLPALPVNYLLAIESGNHLIFCATDAGVYYRTDGMSQWGCFSNKLAKTRITDLSYNYCSKELYASTYGRGVWRSPVNIPTHGAYEEEITTNTVWNSPRDVKGDVVVKAGKVLTITSTVHIDADRKIIVEPGGFLVLDGCTLTNDCGKFWSGIEVWGNKDQPQYAVYQGRVEMRNNAVIEHARYAIRLWKPDDWTSTGGIVRAQNSHFRNNRKDVEFIEYDWALYGVPRPNQSLFRNCTFITDTNYSEQKVIEHVTLFKVYGVQFLGCDFADERNVAANYKSHGIFSLDAKYKVLGTFTGGSPVLSEYYDEANYDECTFTNLRHGIFAMNSNSQNTISVDQSKFTDCETGIRISALDNAMLTRNKFLRTANANWFDYQYDIYADKSSAFQIEGNDLTTSVPDSLSTLGITVVNSGLEDNEVRRNKLNRLAFGTQAYGKNRNAEPISSTSLEGLQMICNTNTENQLFDALIWGVASNDGVRLIQGVQFESVGNELTDPTVGLSYQFYNTTSNVRYYYNTNGSGIQQPTLINNNINPIVSDFPNLCTTNFDWVIPGPGKPVPNDETEMQLIAGFAVLRAEYDSLRMIFEDLLSSGDQQALHDTVASLTAKTKDDVKGLLLSASPYLSESLLLELADKAPAYFPNSDLVDVIQANIELAQNPDFMLYLLNKTTPLPSAYYGQIDLSASTVRGARQEALLQLNKEANDMANVLIKNYAQDSLGMDSTNFSTWIVNRGDALMHVQLADFAISRGDKAGCSSRLSNIHNQFSHLPEGELRTELEFYYAFKTEMLTLTNADGALEGLDSLAESRVRHYAENASGSAQVQAQNLLCFFLNECDSLGDPLMPSSHSALFNQTTDEEQVAVQSRGQFMLYPNPNNGEFTVQLDKACEGALSVMDIHGRIVYSCKVKGDQFMLNLNFLKEGVYFVKVQSGDSLIGLGRLVIQN